VLGGVLSLVCLVSFGL